MPVELYDLAGENPALRFSPFCWRIRMALAHKQIEARTIPWHFGDPLPPGQTTVPVLIDNGKTIGDSTAIALHLEHATPHAPSLFGGAGAEAASRFVIAWADTTLNLALLPILAPAIVHLIRREARDRFRETRERRLGMSFEDATSRRPALLEAARDAMAPLRRTVRQAPFLGGEHPAYLDYAAFGSFQWARCTCADDILEPGDPIAAWRDRLLDLFGGLARTAPHA